MTDSRIDVAWPLRKVVRQGRAVMRTMFFPEVVRRMRATGPVEDLEKLVDLAMRGYWNAITPVQNRQEILALLQRLKEKRPARILEIGSKNGGTLFLFTRTMAPDGLLVSIDLPGGPNGKVHTKSTMDLFQAFPLPGQRLELVLDDSHDPAVRDRVAALAGGAGFDFVLIDGDHTYEGLKSDFEMYGPLVRPGGMIAIHDIDYIPTVRQYWDEIKPGRRVEELRGERAPIFGIGLVHV